MKEKQIFWIVAVTALLSMVHAVGTPLTYSQNAFIHGLGNLFYNNSNVRNPLEMSMHLGLVAYSFVILQKMRKK